MLLGLKKDNNKTDSTWTVQKGGRRERKIKHQEIHEESVKQKRVLTFCQRAVRSDYKWYKATICSTSQGKRDWHTYYVLRSHLSPVANGIHVHRLSGRIVGSELAQYIQHTPYLALQGKHSQSNHVRDGPKKIRLTFDGSSLLQDGV